MRSTTERTLRVGAATVLAGVRVALDWAVSAAAVAAPGSAARKVRLRKAAANVFNGGPQRRAAVYVTPKVPTR